MRKLASLALLLVAFAVGGCSVDTYGKGGFRVDSPLLPRHGQPYASGPAAVGPGYGSTVGPGQPLLSGPQYGNPHLAPMHPPASSGSKVRCMGLNSANGQPILPPPGHPGTGWCNSHAAAAAGTSASASASATASTVAPIHKPKRKPMRPKAKAVGKGSPQPPQPGCKVYGLPPGGQAKGECRIVIGDEMVAQQKVPQSPPDLKPAPATPGPPAKKSSEQEDETLAQKLKKIFGN